jgi:hypothetical protein
LTWDLVSAYKKRNTSNLRHEKGQDHLQDSDKEIKTVCALAVLSFATLSYHMLHFLIQSYRRWSLRKQVPFPKGVSSHGAFRSLEIITRIHVWQWAKESTLFDDFARVLGGEPRRFWWTHLVLVYSLGWNLYMSVEGQSAE